MMVPFGSSGAMRGKSIHAGCRPRPGVKLELAKTSDAKASLEVYCTVDTLYRKSILVKSLKSKITNEIKPRIRHSNQKPSVVSSLYT